MRLLPVLCGLTVLWSCAKEPPPRTVSEFLDNPILLEAAVVRCAKNRNETRYEAECVNAREAVKIIEAKEEAARREALEAASERKRRALRRTQQAAAEARRRAEEAERQRQEEEYLSQFGESPDAVGEAATGEFGNVPGAVLPPPREQPPESAVSGELPSTDGEGAPLPETPAESEAPGTDLDAIRDELRRRGGEQDTD